MITVLFILKQCWSALPSASSAQTWWLRCYDCKTVLLVCYF